MRYSKTGLIFEDNTSSHPTEDDLEEFVFSRLNGAELERLEEHLLGCETCRRRLAETEVFVASTRAAARKVLGAPQPQPKPRRFSPLAMAWAAALAIALLLGYFTLQPRFTTSQRVVLVAQRGEPASKAQARTPLDLELGIPGANESEVRWLEIVDAQGAKLHSAAVSASQGIVRHRSPPLPSGQTWVRLYAEPSPTPQMRPLHEYNLIVQ